MRGTAKTVRLGDNDTLHLEDLIVTFVLSNVDGAPVLGVSGDQAQLDRLRVLLIPTGDDAGDCYQLHRKDEAFS